MHEKMPGHVRVNHAMLVLEFLHMTLNLKHRLC